MTRVQQKEQQEKWETFTLQIAIHIKTHYSLNKSGGHLDGLSGKQQRVGVAVVYF